MPTVTLRLNKKLSIRRTIESYCKNTYEIIQKEKKKGKTNNEKRISKGIENQLSY